ncbi:MAG: sensor histidine kinase [Patescibacteria group bacterium]
MSIFQTARLKLTAWYLLIIMLVSLSFSAVIYRALTIELERMSRIQRYRIENRLRDTVVIPLSENFPPPLPDPELLLYVKNRILTMLALVNGSIFFLAGALGYLLAGRTLTPIADMVDEQNRFISDASHELRTPLTALKSTMEVSLRDKHLSLAEARTVIKESIADVDTLQRLSDSLLSLTRYQKPITNSFEKFSLRDTVVSAIKQMTPLAEEKHITITGPVVDHTIFGNRYSIRDLIVILLDNAIKYGKNNGTINIHTEKKDKGVMLTVSDDGIGIAKKDLPRIFDRFYRADTARTKNAKNGYGLGLSIAKKIMTAHNGTISATSKINGGSTFTVTFV